MPTLTNLLGTLYSGPQGAQGVQGTQGTQGSPKTNVGLTANIKTSAYTLTTDDVGEFIGISTGGITISPNTFSVGDCFTIYNSSGIAQTITQGAGTSLYIAGTASTGNVSMAGTSIITILCVSSNTFAVSGKTNSIINYDLTVPAAINAPGIWNFATNGNLVLTTPGTYNITVNRTISKTVKMWGAGGGGSSWNAVGGGGGAAVGTVNFTVGSYVFVVGTRGIRIDASGGSIPGYGSGGISNPTPGGANYATGASYYGGSGGGGTGIHNGVSAILVAGGGGGGAYGQGGNGGGTSGTAGSGGGGGHGGGGDQTNPGSAGANGSNPTPASTASAGETFNVSTGSNGGNSAGNQPYISGGGGGGGWRGGGGAGTAYGVYHGAGGGGSGYTNPSFVSSATLYAGSATSAGNNTDPTYNPAYGFGGTANGSAPATAAGGGAIIIVA